MKYDIFSFKSLELSLKACTFVLTSSTREFVKEFEKIVKQSGKFYRYFFVLSFGY